MKLGDFGSLALTLSNEGTDAKKDFTTARIQKYSVPFRQTKLFMEVINTVGYVKE